MRLLKDIAEKEYLKLTEFLSPTKLMNMSTPAEYIHRLLNKEVTEPMIFGSMFHSYILEYDKFRKKYAYIKI